MRPHPILTPISVTTGQGDYYEDGREVFDEENDEFQHQKVSYFSTISK